VGGGIRSIEEAQEKWSAGANVVVIGTAIEKNLSLLEDFAKINEGL
jgi:heptaprenylglyceryl phosphate synthase